MNVLGRRVAPTGLLYTLAILMSTATGRAAAQSATCTFHEQNGWGMFGESGKDVCRIAQDLLKGTCGLDFIPSLNETIHSRPHSSLGNIWYTVSRFEDDAFPKPAKRCFCDRVMFNLLSACAGCQKWEWSEVNTTHITWQTFRTYQDDSCSSSDLNELEKRAITWSPPPPAWASGFNADTFDPVRAQPTSTATDSTSASSSSTSLAAAPVAETSSVTGNAAQSANSSGPPIGAIVGGVIGGLIFLGAIAGLAFWIYRRNRRARDVAPSSEFLKPEYYASPPLLPAQERRESYRDEIEEETRPSPTNRRSWAGGLVMTRRHEEDDDDCEMLPPFTQGAYIGPSPHEKGHPERRDTGDTDITMRTHNTTSFLLPAASPNRRPGPSDFYT